MATLIKAHFEADGCVCASWVFPCAGRASTGTYHSTPVAINWHELPELRIGEVSQLIGLHRCIGEGGCILWLQRDASLSSNVGKTLSREVFRPTYQADRLQPLLDALDGFGEVVAFAVPRHEAGRTFGSAKAARVSSAAGRRTNKCLPEPGGPESRKKQLLLRIFLFLAP